MNLEGKTALITGGSQGLGRALGQALAAQGAHVMLVARHAEALDRTVAGIVATGGRATGIMADIGDPTAVGALAARAQATGPVDILVHNASTLGPTPMPLLLDIDARDLSRTFEVNLVGPFRLTQALLGPMVLRGQGVVIAISSDAAVEAYPTWGAYGASKAALDHLTRIWAAEVEGTGVLMIAVDPGEMDTAMHARALPDADPTRLAQPEEVAERILSILQSDVSGVRVAA